jgi:hypothetical protein
LHSQQSANAIFLFSFTLLSRAPANPWRDGREPSITSASWQSWLTNRFSEKKHKNTFISCMSIAFFSYIFIFLLINAIVLSELKRLLANLFKWLAQIEETYAEMRTIV